MAGKRGCLKKILIGLLICLVLAVFILIAAFSLAVGGPLSYPAPKYGAGETSAIANIVTRLARSLVDKEGRVVDTAVLKLSQKEVQTLIDAAIARSIRVETLSLPYRAVWDAGRLHVNYSMPTSIHGKAVNLSLELSPYVEDGELTLIPGSGSAGRLPLPGFALDIAADKLAEMAMRDDSTRTALSAFTRIEPGEDGTLLLMFDPRDVNTVVRVLKSAGEPREELDRDEDDSDEDEESDGDDDPDEDDDEEDRTEDSGDDED